MNVVHFRGSNPQIKLFRGLTSGGGQLTGSTYTQAGPKGRDELNTSSNTRLDKTQLLARHFKAIYLYAQYKVEKGLGHRHPGRLVQ